MAKRKADDVPAGYSVHRTYGDKWNWESILAPESHSGKGCFNSYEEAAEDCRNHNPE